MLFLPKIPICDKVLCHTYLDEHEIPGPYAKNSIITVQASLHIYNLNCSSLPLFVKFDQRYRIFRFQPFTVEGVDQPIRELCKAPSANFYCKGGISELTAIYNTICIMEINAMIGVGENMNVVVLHPC